MSKIGRLAIKLPSDVAVTVTAGLATVTGKLGELQWQLPAGMKIDQQDQVVSIINEQPADPASRALYGLSRAKIANLVKGVSEGFERVLEISGVGFRGELHDNELWLHVGFSHVVKLSILPGVSIKLVKNEIIISGIDKDMVGEMAARIRSTKKPEPYKGKGIKYKEEIIRRKQGKTAKTTTA